MGENDSSKRFQTLGGASQISLGGGVESGGRARVPPADAWAFKDPLREKTLSSLKTLNTRIQHLHSAETLKANARRRPIYTAPSPGANYGRAGLRNVRESSESIPHVNSRQWVDDDIQYFPGIERKSQVKVPRVEARNRVLREVDRKAQKVVTEVTREYIDHFKNLALKEFDIEVKRWQGMPGSHRIRARLERILENKVLRAVDIEIERLKGHLPELISMRQTIIVNARDDLRSMAADLERRLQRDLQMAMAPRPRGQDYRGQNSMEPSQWEDDEFGYDDDIYMMPSVSRRVSRVGPPRGQPSSSGAARVSRSMSVTWRQTVEGQRGHQMGGGQRGSFEDDSGSGSGRPGDGPGDLGNKRSSAPVGRPTRDGNQPRKNSFTNSGENTGGPGRASVAGLGTVSHGAQQPRGGSEWGLPFAEGAEANGGDRASGGGLPSRPTISGRPSMRRMSGIGLALESLPTDPIRGFRAPIKFHFYQPDEAADAANRKAAVALARRRSISGSTAANLGATLSELGLNFGGGVLSSAPSIVSQSTTQGQRQRRGSIVGAMERQQKVVTLSETDKDIHEYLKGTGPFGDDTPPSAVRFASSVNLSTLDLDLLFTKEKMAFYRLEQLLTAAGSMESIDLSHNSLGLRWLPTVLDQIEVVREQVRRLDLSGNHLSEPEHSSDPAELVLPPEEVLLPRVPSELIVRRNLFHDSKATLGDFFYIVDMEEARRGDITFRPPPPNLISKRVLAVEPEPSSSSIASRTSRGVHGAIGRASRLMTSAAAVLKREPRISFGVRVLRDFLRRMGGVAMTTAEMNEIFTKKKPEAAAAAKAQGKAAATTAAALAVPEPSMDPRDRFEPILETLLLRYNGLEASSLAGLVDGLDAIKCLRELDLSQNSLGPDSGPILADLVRSCRSLKALALSWCDLGPEAVFHLVAAATDNVPGTDDPHPMCSLDLSHNPLGPEVTPALHHLALESSSIYELHLSGCRLDAQAAYALASATLDRPESFSVGLRLLNIVSNAIGEEGVNALKMIVRQRFVSDQPRMFLFADGYDDPVFVDTLARLQRANSSRVSMASGADPAHADMQRSRLQRRLSQNFLQADEGSQAGSQITPRGSRPGSKNGSDTHRKSEDYGIPASGDQQPLSATSANARKSRFGGLPGGDDSIPE